MNEYPQYGPPSALPKKKSAKIFWILGAILVIIIIVAWLSIATLKFDEPEQIEISENNLLGISNSLSLVENQTVVFNLKGREYTFEVYSIEEDLVMIYFKNSSKHGIVGFPIVAGMTQRFDIDKDGDLDIITSLVDVETKTKSFLFKKIEQKIARITLQGIADPECVEETTCSPNWATCEQELQSRLCWKSMKCGGISEKIAGSNFYVARACDMEDDPESTPNLVLECGGDIDCFIGAIEGCNLANLTYDFTFNLYGWEQDHNYYYELQGPVSGNCSLYMRIEDVSGGYDAVTTQTFLDSGMTQSQIDQQEQGINDALQTTVGKDGTCLYSEDKLTQIFSDLKVGTYSSENYGDCTGEIFGS